MEDYSTIDLPLETATNLASKLGLSSLSIQREDLHPLESHKGRSIPHMINEAIKSGFEQFVISSSGNAAIASALYIKELNQKNKKYKLTVYVGKKINNTKYNRLKELKDENINILISERPLQAMQNKAKENGIKSLRQSTDPLALSGYNALATKLIKQKVDYIFVPASSGTLAEALLEIAVQSKAKAPRISIVQTEACHPIAEFINGPSVENSSMADAIVDKIAYRKERINKLMKENGGSIYVVKDEDIKNAMEMLYKYENIRASANGSLSLAGIIEGLSLDLENNKKIIAIICGQ